MDLNGTECLLRQSKQFCAAGEILNRAQIHYTMVQTAVFFSALFG